MRRGAPAASTLTRVAPMRRRAHVEACVLRIVRELTGASPDALAAETPLMEAGVDSLAATELSSRLRALTGVALSPTIVFEQPTPRALAAHLVELAGASAVASAAATATAAAAEAERSMLVGARGQWPDGYGGELARRQLQQAACGVRQSAGGARQACGQASGRTACGLMKTNAEFAFVATASPRPAAPSKAALCSPCSLEVAREPTA